MSRYDGPVFECGQYQLKDGRFIYIDYCNPNEHTFECLVTKDWEHYERETFDSTEIRSIIRREI